MATSILVTKLFIPPTRAELVPRPGLIERLNHGLDRKLTLLSAPAGFGKTTLVSHWVEHLRDNTEISDHPIKVAWLSLNEGDNDPVRFLTYFITALIQIKSIETDLGQGALSMIQSPQPPPTNNILISLINDLAAIPDKIVFVLDDYHLIETGSIHQALVFLLKNLPPQLHLVIATRQDPPLSLGRLRARNQITELRAADLRFTSSEAADFLNQVMGLNLSSQDIAELETRTEGWIAGLHLAAISMQGRKDHTDFIKAFTGSNRLVLDYLVEDVLNQQPNNVQDFLMQTAILDQLTGVLCDALTGQDNGQQTLEYLEQANLFIVSLDNERQWYRYHHLFADLLRQKVRQTHQEQIPSLHRRASEWYEQEGLLSDAIRHALAAEEYERAADLAELAWPARSGSSQSIAWLGWVKELPEEIVRARPVLCIAFAQALLNAGKLEAAEARLIDVERWLEPMVEMSDRQKASSSEMVVVDEEQFQGLPASLATARAYHAQAVGNLLGTVKFARRALDLLPEEDHYRRGALTALLGLAHWASGDLLAAHQTFSEGLASMQKAGNVLGIIGGTFVLADIKMRLGRLHEALRICVYGLQLAVEYGESTPLGTEDVYTEMSILHCEQGDLEAAAQDLAASKKLGDQVELPDWQYRWCIAKARLKETQGDLDGALDLLDRAARLFIRTPLPDVRPIAAVKARVWVRQGRLAEAEGWTFERGLSVDDDLSFLREFEHITLARVLIARYKSGGGDDSINKAINFLERLQKAAEEGMRMGSVIEILVLQALAHHARGDIPSALKSLERALILVEPEGFIRIFVDEGPPMASLLYEALDRGIATDYVQRLLAAFPVTEPEEAASTKSQVDQSGLIEPLSEREIEVLQLIAKGLTNPVIATRLVLSVHTIKTHTRNIYSKLAVNNRTQAVVRARTLGILPPT